MWRRAAATTCEGEGFVCVELLFMPSVYAPCPTCHGARYNAKTLEVQYHGRNIAQVLDMTVEEAQRFFDESPAVAHTLRLLREIGLGYLRLGQPATELSGGEAQRIKLITELQRQQRGATLYVIDEPTIGLHPADVDKLMTQLNALVDAGNTVIVAEHEMRVAAGADWLIDMGPGAGDLGGTCGCLRAAGRGGRCESRANRRLPGGMAARRGDVSGGSGIFTERLALENDTCHFCARDRNQQTRRARPAARPPRGATPAGHRASAHRCADRGGNAGLSPGRVRRRQHRQGGTRGRGIDPHHL